jgi:hypothetical protein
MIFLILLSIAIFIALIHAVCTFLGIAFLGSILTGTNRKFGRGKQPTGTYRVACPTCSRALFGPAGRVSCPHCHNVMVVTPKGLAG